MIFQLSFPRLQSPPPVHRLGDLPASSPRTYTQQQNSVVRPLHRFSSHRFVDPRILQVDGFPVEVRSFLGVFSEPL